MPQKITSANARRGDGRTRNIGPNYKQQNRDEEIGYDAVKKLVLTKIRTKKGIPKLKLQRENKRAFSDKKKAKFLQILAETCNVTFSAKQAGVKPSTVYRHRKMDAIFDKNWMEALKIAFENLLLEMLQRARFGVEKPIIHGGEIKGHFKHYDDAMGLKLLQLHASTVAQYQSQMANENQKDNSSDAVMHDNLLNDILDKLEETRERLKADNIGGI
ncbi:hypothetical protein LPB140_11155 [Sphingorhabdus lutea]|uniref:Uncharacterized protein n=1 Tax=Sphingorhabdus lutea TaxID=1913578 RepID=A0A1L3JDN0_9SPHN|nr:hypothetical protein [Sphingorhabdus lutea]APG63251.1 hypothetical protein LPB140_11155 [Sphingorhabdus lutea]